jgi:hypothetical protein
MVKEKMRCSVSDVVKGGHGFNPFGKITDCDNDVFVSIAIWRVASHEVYAPFSKGACNNDWVEKSRWCSWFVGILLTFVTSFHDVDAIVKKCGPKIACSNDFLGSRHP